MSDNCIQFSTERFKKVKMYKPVSEEDDLVRQLADMTMSPKEDDEDSITSFPSLNSEELSD